jgi:hypothetical protein
VTLAEARALAQHKGAFCHGDRYMILNTATGEPLESHRLECNAQYFCDAVNAHETKNGRPAVYTVERLTV